MIWKQKQQIEDLNLVLHQFCNCMLVYFVEQTFVKLQVRQRALKKKFHFLLAMQMKVEI
jgi:hypothetical protein